jgi:RNA-directed DNA polymerase
MAELPRPTTKQELYDRIRSSSKDEVILEEMIRLGFWTPADVSTSEGTPSDPRAEQQRIGELERRLQQLAQDSYRLQNLDQIKKELHEKRLREARQRREETKQRREQERQARARAWQERKTREILFLGEGVSHSLGKREGKVREGLPQLLDAAALAKAMKMPLGLLRFLAFHKRVSAVSHWRRFQVPKKTGGMRTISAPMPRLKAAQRFILEHILEKVPVHETAHGFVAGRSIVSNAARHVGREVVVNFDLLDFFPTLTWVRVRGLFASLGFSPEISTILALLCTEAETDEIELDGKRWYVHSSERRLPQGSPCSPAITNLVCMRLDQRLDGLARKLGYTYTRYADDLTFSGPPDKVHTLLVVVKAIVEDEGFALNPDKTRVMRKGGRQEVTGLVVNRKLGVSRELLRKWRAVMFQVDRDGPEGKKLGPSPDVLASLVGFASFVHMVEPEKGKSMLESARALSRRFKGPAPVPPEGAPQGPPEEPPPEGSPRWWEFWKKET